MPVDSIYAIGKFDQIVQSLSLNLIQLASGSIHFNHSHLQSFARSPRRIALRCVYTDPRPRTRVRPSVNTFDEMLRDFKKRTRWRTLTRISVNAPLKRLAVGAWQMIGGDCGFNASTHSFVYTSGHCRRWRSRMEVYIMVGSLFVHCKIAYFYSVTAAKWLIVSLPNFVTIKRTHFYISCQIFSWIRSTKLKILAMEFCDFIKDSVSRSGLFVLCSLTVTSTWRPSLTAHCPIRERH